MIILERITKADIDLKNYMNNHYSAPRGFVGRQIIYKIFLENNSIGAIAGGSATKFLPNRPPIPLDNIINNVFFHIEKPDAGYPQRNFTTTIVKLWRQTIEKDWKDKYGFNVLGFETLVELPRTGELYLKDGWRIIGKTKGYTCKRIGGKSTDTWTGKRVWNTTNLRPKLVLYKEN